MKTRLFALITSIAILLIACESTPVAPDTTPVVNKSLVSTTTVNGLTIELYADAAFSSGYNPVYVKLLRGSTMITDAEVDIVPMMDMGMMKHSAPVENPGDSADKAGLFSGAVVFTMAGSADQWSLTLQIHDRSTDTEVETTIPVSVAASSNIQLIKLDGSAKTFITMMTSTWKVGMNSASFRAYTTTDGFVYTHREDLAPWLKPTMPSMGHGSSGNVDPSHIDDGLYTGKVNLTMTGDWDLEFGWVQNDTRCRVHFPIQVR